MSSAPESGALSTLSRLSGCRQAAVDAISSSSFIDRQQDGRSGQLSQALTQCPANTLQASTLPALSSSREATSLTKSQCCHPGW